VTAEPLIELRAVSKRFGGVQALDSVSLRIGRRAVHGLVGENGAGKSTLAKIIAGVHQPDSGAVLVDGDETRFRTPRQALGAGIAAIAQEIALVPARPVAENVLLGIEPRRLGVVDGRELRRRFDELDRNSGFGLPGEALVRRLRPAQQQQVEILRALARQARLIVMDEPTASLTADEAAALLRMIRTLAESDTSTLLVSHKLDEVLSVADTVTVMRDGQVVRTGPVAEETPHSLIAGMIGRAQELTFPPKRPPPPGAAIALEARELSRQGVIEDVNLQVHAGEIVGLAGLVGSGRSEVARALFGADPLDAGEIRIGGKPARIARPRDAVRAGIAMVPESRKDQGLLMVRPVRENETLPRLREFTNAGVVRLRREREQARRLSDRTGVRAPSIETPVVGLSGGNQQKVLFAKWLLRRPRVLIADEPTRGVDVGAKSQLHEMLAALAAEGVAILLISSEVEEVLGLAHRVLVMHDGRLVAELAGEEASEESIMRAAFGAQPAR
jgi:ABC-type sugar transport system ATPase subunit